jgi:hypothetical protein
MFHHIAYLLGKNRFCFMTHMKRLFGYICCLVLLLACTETAENPTIEQDQESIILVGDSGLEDNISETNDMDNTEDIETSTADMLMESDLSLEIEDQWIEPDFGPELLRDLTLNSVVPNRGNVLGGDRVQIIGTGFSETTRFIFDRISCGEIVFESSTRVSCISPAGEAEGSITVKALDERTDGTESISHQAEMIDGFSYYIPLSVEQITPNRGPKSGNYPVTFAGTGFMTGTIVNFGDQRSLDVTMNLNGTMTALAPPSESGYVNVRVQNSNGTIDIPQAYYYYERLDVNQVEPAVGSINGGATITLIGQGLLEESTILFANRPAEVLNTDGSRLLLRLPSAMEAGAVDIQISNDNGTITLEEGFIYYTEEGSDFNLLGITPNRGPLQGGQTVSLAGQGLSELAEIYFGGRRADCTYINAQHIDCLTPASMVGTVDITVSQNNQEQVLSNGYLYYQDLLLTSVFPDHGSIAGGTLVEITGVGFTNDTQVMLGEFPLTDIQVFDEILLRGITMNAPVGVVDVRVSNSATSAIIENGFEYFDPTSSFGGVWGDDLDISMNVTVINGGSFEPEPDVQLLLVTQEDVIIEAVTGADGRATLSHPRLTSPANITAAKEAFEVTTLEDIEVENITIILVPHPEGNGGPPPGVPPARIRGTIRGLDLIPKPNNETLINVAFVETTHTQPSNRNDLPPPGPGGILLEDGSFEIIARLGELAIVVTAGTINRNLLNDYNADLIDYQTLRSSLNEEVMGVRRFISARSNETVEGIHVDLDHPLDYDIPIDFDNPPYDPVRGPSYYITLPRLNFGADGFWELTSYGLGLIPSLTIEKMPRLDGWGTDVMYFFLHAAFSDDPTTPALEIANPLSIHIQETNDTSAGVFVTPFAPVAYFVNPLPGQELGEERILSWSLSEGYYGVMEGLSATVVSIAEPALGPPTPLWRYVVPPGVTEIEIPQLSILAGETGLNGGFMFLDINPFIASGNFDYNDFSYMDINGSRWKSYGISSTTFNE